jgi:hypothetical protein
VLRQLQQLRQPRGAIRRGAFRARRVGNCAPCLGLLASLLLVPSALAGEGFANGSFANEAFANEALAGFEATISNGMCVDDGKSVTARMNDRSSSKPSLVTAGKTNRDPGILAAASSRVHLEVGGYKLSAAAVADQRGEVCSRQLSAPAAASRPVRLHEVLACPLIGTGLEGAPESSLVDEYLCGVYWRMPRKVDDAGDFTWKDGAAAARVRRTVCEYAIGGMHRDLREALYALGRQADEAGINWSILSAFRDDYRQSIATGFRAERCQSWHGGSCKTKGWGDGQAADLWVADQNGDRARDASPLFELIDRVGRTLGLTRPMRSADPPHVQVGGDWQRIGEQLREKRLGITSAKSDETASGVMAEVRGDKR